jgi:methyl acetate hydrolase
MNSSLDDLLSSSELPGLVATVLVDGEVVYEGATGVRRIGGGSPMTIDSVLGIFSMTKAVTGAAAMHLVERGKLDLDEPAGTYLADLGDLQVFEGFNAGHQPRLRAAKSSVTLRHLLTHTSGFGYDAWDAELGSAIEALGIPSFSTQQKAGLKTPLMFDPGTAWEYGIGIDWVGLLVEAASGQTLGEYCAEHLFGPLGMTSTGFAPTTEMAARLHIRTPGGFSPIDWPSAPNPEFEMGGGGLLSTVGDYARFAQMILDGGRAGDQQILGAATVTEMGRNQLGDIPIRRLVTATHLAHDLDVLPGTPKGWGLSFLLNLEQTPQGRSAGSLAWAGLANSYYWIDPTKRVVGVWATQLFPFQDPTVTAELEAFESAVYASVG